MTSAGTIERLCLIIQEQARIINIQNAALEQFGAAEQYNDEIKKIEEMYQSTTGDSLCPEIENCKEVST